MVLKNASYQRSSLICFSYHSLSSRESVDVFQGDAYLSGPLSEYEGTQ